MIYDTSKIVYSIMPVFEKLYFNNCFCL